MGRNQKLYTRLDALEEEYRQRLLTALKGVADGAGGFLFLTDSNPHYGLLNRYLHAEVAGLETLGKEIVILRRKLKEPLKQSLYFRFQQYRTKWNDTSDDHRLTDQRLARQLLDEVNSGEA